MTVARGPPGRPSSGLLACWRRRPPLGFGAKVGIAIALGLSFAIIWTSVSPTSTSQQISTERSSFATEVTAPPTASHNRTSSSGGGGHAHRKPRPVPHSHKKRHPVPSGSHSHPHRPNATAQPDAAAAKADHSEPAPVTDLEPNEKELEQEQEPDMEMEPEQEAELPMPEESGDNSGKAPAEEDEEKPPQLELEEEPGEGDGEEEDPEAAKKKAPSKKRKLPPLFSPGAHWKHCSAKSGYHYIPCVDFDGDGSQRHHERSCPRSPVTCLVSLPKDYKQPTPWPERKDKVWYGNVAHPRLSNYVKGHNWLNHSGDYLMFPPDEWEFKGGARHYVESIDEMAPDLDWGKNIRIILDIGCKSAGFGIALLEKDAITLSLGPANDQTDLAQVALERGIPATVGSLGSRRLPFPSGAFDAIHCGECNIPWHSNGGKLLLEINRILRPGGYFIISSKSADLESEEGISASMTALCWNAIAYNSDDVSEVGVKIFQRPATNEEYDLRAKKDPPFCKEEQNKANAWYTHIKHCLHKAPVGIEERGSDWPEEWPKRLESYPEWLGDLQTRVAADHNHWKAVVEKSYLDGLGIDWSNIRNVMDMRAVYGGFAAALASKKVWVMNVVPVHAADTLPIIYERGLIGVYHDWCEPFSTYPRSYDLLHADHLFSRLKIRCRQPVAIVVEMDRILRPGGWAIIRDKLEILDPLETILKSLHWEIVMTFRKDKEGIMSVKKTTWRP
ncbi:putative methyltransferase PMT28 [Dichanthelium oligosanthes]|uniref:Methyltransferase n=1 Tax=Dichanthelium oligosanthes TaxID=888268 RepID=A0A1E5WAL2_9POAL|nr:putative methyltransferase PMT28 [Dichanthelium oligosanthes]